MDHKELLKVLGGGLPDSPEAADAVLDAMGVPPLPAELRERAVSLTEAELYSGVGRALMSEITVLLPFAPAEVKVDLLKRCCGLARFVNAAVSPGSRIAAAMERETEQGAKPGESTPDGSAS